VVIRLALQPERLTTIAHIAKGYDVSAPSQQRRCNHSLGKGPSGEQYLFWSRYPPSLVEAAKFLDVKHINLVVVCDRAATIGTCNRFRFFYDPPDIMEQVAAVSASPRRSIRSTI
jgi:hypothetical protein